MSLSRRSLRIVIALTALAAVAAATFGLSRAAAASSVFTDLLGYIPFASSTTSADIGSAEAEPVVEPRVVPGTCDTASPIEVEVSGVATGYATLKAAFDAINAGTHTGVLFIDVCGDTTETAPAVLNAGNVLPASWPAITINPVGGAARTISGAIAAGSPLIDLNGADNVTIDGLNGGGNALTISNTTSPGTSGTSTIRFIGGATNNTVTNSTILGSKGTSVATNGGNIFFSTDAVTTNGNDGNTISNNNIGPAGTNFSATAIQCNGSTSTQAIGNSGLNITNNSIFDYFGAAVTSAGIAVNGGCNSLSVTNNRFYQTGTRTWTTGAEHNAILMNSSAVTSGVQGMTVTGNAIGYASNIQTGTYSLTGSTGIFRAIRFNGITGGTVSNINNNTVASVSLTGVTSSGSGTGSPFLGILINNGLVNTNSNIIGSQSATGSLTFSTTSTTATDVYGIYNFSLDDWTANSNNIGGISVTNLAASGTYIIYGLRANTSASKVFNAASNNIGGTVANSISMTATGASSQVIGMASNNAISTWTSNTVRNMTTNFGTGTTNGASMIGMLTTSTSIAHTLSLNTIHTLQNTNATGSSIVTGIQYTGSTGANVVERNLIYNLLAPTTGTGAEINGIRVGGGTTTYRNNMIALGSNQAISIGSTATNTSTSGINGINDALSGSDSFFHNSVYIGGTGTSGSGASFAFNSTITTNTRSFRDNIFFNARTNSGATGSHYAVKINGTAANPVGLTINNNVYFANGLGGVFGFFNGADVANLAAWKTAVGQDAASFESNPQYNDPTNTTPDLHIHATNPTIIEGNGADVGVTNDFDGHTRSGLTPVDIGADAGNFTSAGDLGAPIITYTNLGNTTSTANRILSVIVTDSGSGVPTTGIGLPRLYYRKGTSDPYVSTQCVFTSGSNYDCTFNYSLVTGGTVTAGDTIQYFVAAQDQASTPNVAVNPSGGAAGLTANPPAASTPPSPPASYLISISFTGTRTVCASGCDYTTLTGATGIFNAINNGVLTGNLNVEINGDLTTGETGTTPLNPFTEEPVGSNFTVKIYPTGAARAVSGDSTTATPRSLIRLNAADRVTIDGSIGGTGTDRSLTITNADTSTSSAVVWLHSNVSDGAQNNVIKNVNVVGNSNTTTLIGIGMGSSTISTSSLGTSNNSNTIQNNNISKTQYGIYSQGASALTKNTGNTISQNVINTASPNNVQRVGILVGFENNPSVSENNIAGMSTSGDAIGIALGLTSLTATTFSGNEVTNATVSKNTIGSVVGSGTFSAAGITLVAATSGTTQISNNMISGVISNASPGDLTAGIILGGGAGSTTQVYFNSVSMTGDRGTGTTSPSYALAIGGSTPVVDVRNNILYNTQFSSSTGRSYAIGLGYTSTLGNYSNLTSNNNDLFSGGTLSAFAITGSLTQGTGTDRTSLAAWQSETGRDGASVSANPFFVSTTDLHINTTSGSTVNNAGTPISGITTDFDGETRNGTTPDIGADEFTPPATAPSVTTDAASSITSSSATLNGTGNPNGAATTGWFRYSTASPGTCNDSFGTRAPSVGGSSLGSGTSGVAYSQGITGLTPGTTYFVCAIAQNSVGTSFGSVVSFTTAAIAPSVTTNAASSVTSTSATLNGTGNPNGAATTGWFRYSTVDPTVCDDTFGTRAPSSGGSALGSGTSGVAYSQGITGLTPGTTYFVCAIAQNSVGTSFGSVVSFTTLAAAPTVTTNAASLITSTTATLNGTANPGGAATTGWFRYSTTSPGTCNDTFGTRAPLTGGSSLGSGTSGVAYSQGITGLTPGTTYFACAIAQNSIGTSFGSVVSFGTPSNPSGVGAANPSTVQAGNNTVLTVTVTPGTNPTSTGIMVTGNLSSIGGSATQQFFDDGTSGGDTTAGDNVFTYTATVPSSTIAGARSLPATITDAQSRSANTSIALTVTPGACTPAPSGMVAWWKGEGNAGDAAGSNDGTLQNGAGFDASGAVGQAMSFDGTDDFINVPDAPALNPSSAITLDAWVKLDVFKSGGSIIVAKDNFNTSERDYLLQAVNNQVQFVVFFNPTGNAAATGGTLTLGTWHHVAGTYDGSTIRVYLDGVQVASQAASGTLRDTATPFRIGSTNQTGMARYFDGLIDELEVFNTALSGTSIQAIYNAGSAGKCDVCTPAPSGMVGWWKAENNGTDSAGPNDGTVQNGATFATGKVNRAFSLDGIDDRVSGSSTTNLPLGSSARTITAWVKTNIASVGGGFQDQSIFHYGVSNNDTPPTNFHLFLEEDGSAAVGNGFGMGTTNGNTNLRDDQWHMVTGVYEGPGTNIARIYVDGVEQNSAVITTPGTSGGSWRIGQFLDPFPGQAFDGSIDEVAIFSRALTPSEIADLYNADTAGKCDVCTTAPSNMVLWHRAAGSAVDSVGSNNGTLQGGATFAAGKVGQAYSFDGVDDFVDIANTATMDMGTGNLTIDMWVNLASVSTIQTLFHKVSGSGTSPSDPSYFLEFDTPNLRFRVGDGLSNFNDLIVPVSFVTGRWYHIAAVREGDTNRLYLDGVLIGSQTAGTNVNTGTGGDAVIGKCLTSSCAGRFVNGRVDEVELFSRALTAGEIADIYNAGTAGKCPLSGTLQFNSATYSGAENSGSIALTVTRTGGTDGAVSAQVSFSGGSATGGASCGGSVDYDNDPFTVNFADGSSTPQTVNVPICDDSVFEGNETFSASLGSFTGGATAGSPSSATVTINENEIQQFALTVSRAGAGGGTVTSSPAGINCGTNCSANYDAGTMVTLTATPDSTSTFTGWSGSGCSGTGSCVVTMSQARSVTATFAVVRYTLSVAKSGTGAGTVTSSPAGINCGASCSADYDAGTVVTLTATPDSTSTFTGWSGSGCSGTGSCMVTMSQASTVTATFTLIPLPVITLSSATYSQDESQTLVVTVNRSGGSSTSTAQLTTGGGTATGGTCGGAADYASQNVTVTFTGADNVETVNIPICSDLFKEFPETFNITLSAPSNATLGSPSSASATIVDAATQFMNTSPIIINESGPANPYPSQITVSGATTSIAYLRVTLFDIAADIADDIDVLLVGPQGQSFVLMADAGGMNPVAAGTTLTFNDNGSAFLPDNTALSSGQFKASSWENPASVFPPPAPAGPHAEPGPGGSPAPRSAFLNSVFAGTNANGVWSLYVFDDSGAPLSFAPGTVAGGWGLEVLAPTAASVSLSGRVVDSSGRGIRNAIVTIEGGQLLEPRVIATGSMGWYGFDGLSTGTYLVTVNGKRHTFAVPSRVVTLSESVTNVDFIAEPLE